MTAMLVLAFFIGCVVGSAVATWYHKRPSKFDKWRKKKYDEAKAKGETYDPS